MVAEQSRVRVVVHCMRPREDLSTALKAVVSLYYYTPSCD